MKKLLLLVLISVLLLSLCGCIEGGGNVPSSDATPSAAELTDDEKAAYGDYKNAVDLRASYLSAVYNRTVTENGRTFEMTLTFYTPYGLGTFFFDKVGRLGGKVVISEHFEGSSIIRQYADGIADDGYITGKGNNASAGASLDGVAHTRVPLTADFDLAGATPSSVAVTRNGDSYEYVITFAEIKDGNLLLEYGDKGAYTAKNVTVNATVDGDEVLVYEKITATIVGGGAEKSLVIVTEVSSVNDVPGVPASTPLD